MNKIEIDSSAIAKLSPTDQIGYYQKEDLTFVLTTRSGANRPDFISKIDRIAKLLEEAEFSPEQRAQLSATHTIKIIHYVDHIYRIIDRHNAKVEKIIQDSWLRYLATIPIISYLVHWIFNRLTPPGTFLKHVGAFEKKHIHDYLAQATDIDATIKRKDELTNLVNELEQSQKGKGKGHNAWIETKQCIQVAFENQLDEKVPAVKFAHNLLKTACEDPEKSYREILELTDEADVAKAPGFCNAILANLRYDAALNDMLKAEQKKACEDAKALAVKAYAQWHVQRLCRLGQQKGQSTSIADLLGTTDTKEFAKKYASLSERIGKLNSSSALEAQKILQTCYFDYINKPYLEVERELNAETPLFSKITHAKELYAAYHARQQVLEDRLKFNNASDKNIAQAIAKLKEKLVEAYYRQLKCSVAIFGEATTILNIHAGPLAQSFEAPELTHEAEASAPLKSERWYLHKITLFTIELSQMLEEDYSPEAWKIILDAKQKLLTDLSLLREKQMIENLKAEKKPQSHIEAGIQLFTNFLIGEDKGKKQPLKMYRKNLKKILEIKSLKEVPEAEIERKYKAKLAEIAALPKSEGMRLIVTNTYANYIRATKIQPSLATVASSWSWTGYVIPLEDLLNKTIPDDLIELEKMVQAHLNLLEEELIVQKTKQKNPLVETLESTKALILQRFDDLLLEKYPQYKLIKSINQRIKDKDPTGIYAPILKCNQNADYLLTAKKYEELLESIKIPDKDQPIRLQEAYLEAAQWGLFAYREWEADRILAIREEFHTDIEIIYGVPKDMPKTEKKKRWRKLKLLLHTDKSVRVPPKLEAKFAAAGKLLPDYEDKTVILT